MTYHRTIVAVISVCLGLASSLSTTRSLAEPADLERARGYFQAGAQAYAVGEFETAIQAFEQAYQLVPRPAVLFSIAQAERKQYFLDHKQAHLLRAIDFYRRYLADEPQALRKADAVQALSELEPLVATSVQPGPEKAEIPPPPSAVLPTRLMITSQTPGARISLDGAGEIPPPLIREIEPGEHTVQVVAAGHVTSARRVTAVKGALVTLDIALAEQMARLEVVARDGAQLSIDGRVQGLCPFPKPLELPAGSHLITVTKAGYIGVSREQVLTAGETTVFTAPMPRTWQQTTGLIMFGAAASALTTGIFFAVIAREQNGSAQSFLDARGHQTLSSTDLEQYESLRQDRNRLQAIAWASGGIAAALATAGTLMIVLDQGSVRTTDTGTKAARPTFDIQPTWASNFAGLQLRQDF